MLKIVNIKYISHDCQLCSINAKEDPQRIVDRPRRRDYEYGAKIPRQLRIHELISQSQPHCILSPWFENLGNRRSTLCWLFRWDYLLLGQLLLFLPQNVESLTSGLVHLLEPLPRNHLRKASAEQSWLFLGMITSLVQTFLLLILISNTHYMLSKYQSEKIFISNVTPEALPFYWI